MVDKGIQGDIAPDTLTLLKQCYSHYNRWKFQHQRAEQYYAAIITVPSTV